MLKFLPITPNILHSFKGILVKFHGVAAQLLPVIQKIICKCGQG